MLRYSVSNAGKSTESETIGSSLQASPKHVTSAYLFSCTSFLLHHYPNQTLHFVSSIVSLNCKSATMVLQHANQNHFLLITFPAQGHINPSLQIAKRLIRTGAQVTFVTTVFAHRRMLKNANSFPDGLAFAPFSDGYDDGFKPGDDVEYFMAEVRRHGSDALSGVVEKFANEGRPITCLIYTLLLPWAVEVGSMFQLSSALLWIQPATVFDIYYYYFCGYKDLILENINDPSYSIKLPGLPLLRGQDLPSFFLPSNPYAFGIKLFQEQFELLLQEPKSFPVLVNTFDELEPEALKALDKFNLIGIGPLIPSAFLDGKDPSDKSFGADLFDRGIDYIDWLDSKDEASVVYVSFGSIATLSSNQMEELARGLVDSGRSFLWVIRLGVPEKDEKYSEILQEEHKGLIVPWCSQVEVLNHPSVGCFLTHCGWNSTLETVSMGVPVVAFPQWTDQGTNAKLIEDIWKMGVRVKPREEDKIVTCEEIKRCLEEVMEGESGKEFRSNAKKWKDLARQAVKENGSSESNLRKFVEEIGAMH